MIKKILMVIVIFLGLAYGNNANIGTMMTTKSGSYYTIIEDSESKKLFLTYLLPYPATNVSPNVLDESLKTITEFICSEPKIRVSIDKGYEIIVTYIYSNHIVINFDINACSL